MERERVTPRREKRGRERERERESECVPGGGAVVVPLRIAFIASTLPLRVRLCLDEGAAVMTSLADEEREREREREKCQNMKYDRSDNMSFHT